MAQTSPLRITYLTAGAAGMYCGSCMHDNTLARALVRRGVDVQLVPMYTPIQTDEADASEDQVFFGGINVYLQQRFRLFRHLPSFFDRILDRPRLLRWIGSRGIETKASELGDLAVSILKGSEGFQRKEVQRLCQWLSRAPQPHLINLTNMLVAGCVPDLRAALGVPVTVTLQGDDIFLEQLPESHRRQALEQIGRIAEQVDAFLVHSDYYGDFMSDYLRLPRNRFRRVPLGIDTDGYPMRWEADDLNDEPPRELRIGYLARLAPEKGFDVLVDAFILLQQLAGQQLPVRLQIVGWLGKQHEAFSARQFAKLEKAGLGDRYEYLGSVDLAQKQKFLGQLDVFSVPTVYREPKGLYVLEALAAGTPVVLPRHGAFPELVEATGGGLLVTPNDPAELATALHRLLLDPTERRLLARSGQQAVHQRLNADRMAQETQAVFQQVLAESNGP